MLKNHLIVPNWFTLFIALYPFNGTIVKCGLFGSCETDCPVEPKTSSWCCTHAGSFSFGHLQKCNWLWYSVMYRRLSIVRRRLKGKLCAPFILSYSLKMQLTPESPTDNQSCQSWYAYNNKVWCKWEFWINSLSERINKNKQATIAKEVGQSFALFWRCTKKKFQKPFNDKNSEEIFFSKDR